MLCRFQERNFEKNETLCRSTFCMIDRKTSFDKSSAAQKTSFDKSSATRKTSFDKSSAALSKHGGVGCRNFFRRFCYSFTF